MPWRTRRTSRPKSSSRESQTLCEHVIICLYLYSYPYKSAACRVVNAILFKISDVRIDSDQRRESQSARIRCRNFVLSVVTPACIDLRICFHLGAANNDLRQVLRVPLVLQLRMPLIRLHGYVLLYSSSVTVLPLKGLQDCRTVFYGAHIVEHHWLS